MAGAINLQPGPINRAWEYWARRRREGGPGAAAPGAAAAAQRRVRREGCGTAREVDKQGQGDERGEAEGSAKGGDDEATWKIALATLRGRWR